MLIVTDKTIFRTKTRIVTQYEIMHGRIIIIILIENTNVTNTNVLESKQES